MAKNTRRLRGQTPKANSPQDMTEVLRETTCWRKHHLSYDQSRYVVAQVRQRCSLRPHGAAAVPWHGSISTKWKG